MPAWVCMMYRIQSGSYFCPTCCLRFKSQRQTFMAKFTVQCAWSLVVQSSKTCYTGVAYSTNSFRLAQATCCLRNYDYLHSSLQCPTTSKSSQQAALHDASKAVMHAEFLCIDTFTVCADNLSMQSNYPEVRFQFVLYTQVPMLTTW